MAIYSCDHGSYIVVYEDQRGDISCPACNIDKQVEDLEQEIEDLKSQIE